MNKSELELYPETNFSPCSGRCHRGVAAKGGPEKKATLQLTPLILDKSEVDTSHGLDDNGQNTNPKVRDLERSCQLAHREAVGA